MAEKYVRKLKVPATEKVEVDVEAISADFPNIYHAEDVPENAIQIADGLFPDWWKRQCSAPQKRLALFQRVYSFWSYDGGMSRERSPDIVLFTDGKLEGPVSEQGNLLETPTFGTLIRSSVLPTNTTILNKEGNIQYGIPDVSRYRYACDITGKTEVDEIVRRIREAYITVLGSTNALAILIGASQIRLEEVLKEEEQKAL